MLGAMGKSPALLLSRLFALVLALGLGGSYVWMRQRQAAPPPAAADPEPPASAPGTDEIATGEEKEDRTLLPSSKLGVLPPPEEKGRRLLPGSKSISGVLDDIRREDLEPLPEQREETEEP